MGRAGCVVHERARIAGAAIFEGRFIRLTGAASRYAMCTVYALLCLKPP